MKLIFDCNYICYVHKFALSSGLTYRGKQTEIIYGFLKQILELSKRFGTNEFIFCWDSRESIRKKIWPEYKRNRREERTEEEIEADNLAFKQFNILRRRVLCGLGFRNVFMQTGYESDDLIAYLVKEIPDKYVVVTSDEDLFQLLDYCSLYNITKHTITNKEEFVRTFKISPLQWVDVKTIAGCSSDNVKGIEGVGNKTVAKFLSNELKNTSKAFQKIIDPDSEIIKIRNRELVSLPLPGLLSMELKPELLLKQNFSNIFMEYGFNSFLEQDRFSQWVKYLNLR